jgi:hypothetical protein
MKIELWQIIAIALILILAVAFIIDCIRSKIKTRESWAIKDNRRRFLGGYKELYGPLDFMDAGDLPEEDRLGIGKSYK